MMKMDDSQVRAERMKVISEIDPSVLNERINYNYPDGEEEIAKLLSFVPEENRVAIIQAFVESLLQQ